MRVAFDEKFPQKEQWGVMQRHLTVASLATAHSDLEYFSYMALQEWPVEVSVSNGCSIFSSSAMSLSNLWILLC